MVEKQTRGPPPFGLTPNYGGQPSPDGTKCGIRTCWLLGWRASRSSGVSRAKAGGEGSRTPVSCSYVQQRPRMIYQSHLRGGCALTYRRGRTRMLLVLLLPWQAFGNIRNRSIGPLVSVVRDSGKIAIAKVVIRTRQHLAAVKPQKRGLMLELMHFPKELIAVSEFNEPAEKTVGKAEMQRAKQLIESMTQKWKPEQYDDDYHEALEKLIEEKIETLMNQ